MSEFQKDLPILQEVVNGTWAKESRLNELKTELAAADRKIQLSIAPESKYPESAEEEHIPEEIKNVQEKIQIGRAHV